MPACYNIRYNYTVIMFGSFAKLPIFLSVIIVASLILPNVTALVSPKCWIPEGWLLGVRVFPKGCGHNAHDVQLHGHDGG